ncbi:DNA repair protein RecN [Acidihalobacter prosperus]|uniref:DNA repair protein RecN n=1 Tax=Acidihalobacter prosperus TaxID=160660 RepID=A0A1A6C6Z3_9GAMM|nr:DNA repair protein RecN [Acidihalobacter prosperus]OBS10327.1 DNA repair protein RecN [Acidihalobacter prosperus]
MLSHILIRDFAIIEHLELELTCGMTALTGETGAGKSILIDAIGLVLGDRADSGVVRAGAERAEISAGFDLGAQPNALAWLRAHDLEDDDGACTLRRIVTREGRARAYIGGTPVALQALREFGEQLVDIHGQHAHQSLLHRDAQRGLLDLQAGHAALLEELAAAHRQWTELKASLAAIEDDAQHRQARLELVEFQCGELETAAPRAGEADELEDEHRRLAHASQLLEAAQAAYGLAYDGEPDANGLLSHAVDALDHAASLDPRLDQSLALLRNAQIEVQEAAAELRRYLDDLQIDPARLDEIGARLALLQSLARKHHCEIDELPERLSALQQERESLVDHDSHRTRLNAKLASAAERYRALAERVSAGRREAATTLGHEVTEAMQTLGMSGGRFAVAVENEPRAKPSHHGIDQVEFQVSANPGQPLRPLAKVASGGELSRISLALQLAATRDRRLPTLIFDEVDSGIGGGVAEVVGRMLRRLGADRQILCVTHLPQVAAQAHQQLAVRKIKDSDSTETLIEPLITEPARIDELARMLGGVRITPQSQAHAQEMLRGAQEG